MKRKKAKRIISYQQAINEALYQAMKRDSRVFVYGVDVADHKRILGTTAGLVEHFGQERCFSTPLAEEALTGFGLGAALAGLRPVLIHIRVDFMLLAMNQLINMVATQHYGSGGKLKVPLVIRAMIGRGWGQGFQHSKSLYSLFAHIPGIKVVLPASPSDAKGLLLAAIADENPVIFLDHRWFHWVEGEVPEEPYLIPLGQSKLLQRGTDYTVVATSWLNVEAVRAAAILAKRGVAVTVIDPRTITPLDDGPIITSVKKTGHCLIADYDWLFCGFGAEVAARVAEQCFSALKSPVRRLGFAAAPCPTTRPLEDQFYPNAITIIRTIEKDLGLKPADLKKEEFYSYEHRFKGPF